MQEIIYNWSGDRIDIYLSKTLNYSRNFFHHLIGREAITVNWKIIKKSYKIKNDDIIIIQSLERYLSDEILSESPNFDIEIKLEKDDYLIINKPKWILSHPNSIWDISKPSVVWFLYHKYKNLPSIWNFIRAGLVHRLDKNTNWLMIIAKTEKGLKYFKELFNQKSIATTIEEKEKIALKKFYKAIVNITNDGENFLYTIKDNLPFYINEIVKTKTKSIKEFKNWITKILKTSYSKNNQAELYIEILTWRTHQIRYHLSNKWLPIVWDELYWLWENEELWLTAYCIEFLDPNWEYVNINI